MDHNIVTRDASGNPTSVPTAKVAAGGVSAGALVVLVAILTAITPDLLAPLGPWAPIVLSGITALAGFLGGYLKSPTGVK